MIPYDELPYGDKTYYVQTSNTSSLMIFSQEFKKSVPGDLIIMPSVDSCVIREGRVFEALLSFP